MDTKGLIKWGFGLLAAFILFATTTWVLHVDSALAKTGTRLNAQDVQLARIVEILRNVDKKIDKLDR